ncbi:MAG: EVE domain-containing protein [Proteobacteria bacterium]|nr:EVE domain-containing protein [Pseudomonadota bacterium]
MSPRNWIAIASAEHVRIGRAQGFMQVCHGKRAPLRRLSTGDCVAYYSPTEAYRGKDRLQAVTAVGVIAPGEPYQADMGGGFHPFRRNVHWRNGKETPIRPLLPLLAFSRDNKNWGYQLRFGLFEIEGKDMALIADAMGVDLGIAA